MEYDTSDDSVAEIVWGHQPLARKVGNSWYYYIYNAHGDVIGLVNDAGTVVNNYTYDAWGSILSETETVDNPIKYAGEYYDDELDMYYLRARYYDPSIGRFTSYDIQEGDIINPLDMNRYVYCRNNPLKYVDPNGENSLNAGVILRDSWLLAGGAAVSDTVAPFGDVIGLVIGLSGTIYAGGVAIYNKFFYSEDNTNSLPTIGEPNSSKDLLNPDGTVKQRRYYGPDGKAQKDVDYNHSNGDGSHTFPHTHEWDWSSGKGIRK